MKVMNYFEKLETQGYYIIAEIGVNYYDIAEKENMSLVDAAKLMITEAKQAGADAVKFQSYTARGLAAQDSPSYWDTNEIPLTSQYEFFKQYEKMGRNDYEILSKFSEEMDIDFMSTPFDFDAADYLEPMMNLYKISSSDLTNHPFVKYISQKNMPVLLSVGASNEREIDETVSLIRKNNKKKLTILHCVLEYPTPYEHANLMRISALSQKYPECIIGYSDHTKPDECMDVIKSAYLLGAKVIEKHFTLDKAIKGKNDHFHSMDPSDLRKIKSGLEFIKSIMGKEEIGCLETEEIARRNARRSIVAEKNICKGEIITEEKLTFKRPGTGIAPYDLAKVIGKVAKCDIREDAILQYEMIE